MKKPATKAAATPETVEAYIAQFPADVRARLARVRAAIRKAAPEAEESITYRIPTFKLEGPLLYFAAFSTHIGIYPVTAALKAQLGKELAPYTSPKAKGTMRFPLDAPLPIRLIGRIARIRVLENRARRRGA